MDVSMGDTEAVSTTKDPNSDMKVPLCNMQRKCFLNIQTISLFY